MSLGSPRHLYVFPSVMQECLLAVCAVWIALQRKRGHRELCGI